MAKRLIKEREIKENSSPWVKRIDKLLKEKNMTQHELANHAKVTESTVSGWLTPKNPKIPRVDNFIDVAEELNVSLDYLAGKSENRIPDNKEIGDRLGLTDSAIAELSKMKSNKEMITIVNSLIEDRKLLECIKNYFMYFIEYEIQKSDYREVPLKANALQYSENDYYVLLTQAIGESAQKFKGNCQKNGVIKELTLEYLAHNIDNKRARDDVYMIETWGQYESEERPSDYYNQPPSAEEEEYRRELTREISELEKEGIIEAEAQAKKVELIQEVVDYQQKKNKNTSKRRSQ